jgi:hypothetical protein
VKAPDHMARHMLELGRLEELCERESLIARDNPASIYWTRWYWEEAYAQTCRRLGVEPREATNGAARTAP